MHPERPINFTIGRYHRRIKSDISTYRQYSPEIP